MVSINGACCSEPTTSSPTTPIAVWAVVLGEFINMERSAALEGSSRARRSRDSRCGCAGSVSRSVDHRLLEPLWAEHVRALQCFLAEWCALARAAHAFVRLCGAGGSASRVRSRYVCVTSERCTAGCLGTEIGTVRAHDGPVRRLMACLNPHRP